MAHQATSAPSPLPDLTSEQWANEVGVLEKTKQAAELNLEAAIIKLASMKEELESANDTIWKFQMTQMAYSNEQWADNVAHLEERKKAIEIDLDTTALELRSARKTIQELQPCIANMNAHRPHDEENEDLIRKNAQLTRENGVFKQDNEKLVKQVKSLQENNAHFDEGVVRIWKVFEYTVEELIGLLTDQQKEGEKVQSTRHGVVAQMTSLPSSVLQCLLPGQELREPRNPATSPII